MTATLNLNAVDAAQIERFLKMLYEGASGMPVFASYPEKGQTEGRFEWGFYPAGEVARIVTRCRARNEDEHRGVAMSVATYWGNSRHAENAASLGALAIDIDQDDLLNLVPGATDPAQVIDEVLGRLQPMGLRPHAMLSSGNGLHVYLLLERIYFKWPVRTDAAVIDRERVEATWKKLGQLLGGSTDRHDLASIMRLPGTVNRKYGGHKRTGFLDEHTDLTHPRYRFETVEKAVADVVVTQARRKKTARTGSSTSVARMATTRLEDWQKRMLEYAVAHDPKFKARREGARVGQFEEDTDRSRIEFAYACRLLEMGFPEEVAWAEISACAKGSEAGPRYVDSTILAAAAKVSGENLPRTTVTFSVIENTPSAFYTLKKSRLDGFYSFVPVVNWSLPNVTVVMARPGGAKTTGLLDLLSTQWSGVGPYDRVGVCGMFVNELLKHEHTINAAFPAGMSFEVNGRVVEYDRDAIPSTAKAFYKALPNDIKLLSRGNQPVWTVGRLEQHPSPRGLLLNAMSPYAADERFDVEEPVLPHSRYPNAVVKFSPREDLCLAGYSQHKLATTPICSKDCLLTQCRSNMTEDGMRRIWNAASVALLTHKAFEAQVLYQPNKNDFECIIFDELPQSVYRNSRIKVWPTKAGARRWRWSCEPLDSLVSKLEEALNKVRDEMERLRAEISKARASNDDDAQKRLAKQQRRVEEYLHALPGIIKRVEARRALLVKQAAKAKTEREGKLERMAARDVEPLLSTDDFEILVSLQSHGRVVQDLDEDEYDDNDLELIDEDARDGDAEEDTAAELGSVLPKIRDFCGDHDLTVYYEHSFTKKTRGSFCIFRPVDGWQELVLRPGGAGRRTVVLDATAGLDPRYQLLGVAKIEEAPSGSYPNATVVLTSKATVTKTAVESRKVTIWDIVGRVVGSMKPYRTKIESLLVVTTKRLAPSLRKSISAKVTDGMLPPRTAVEHFGNLRGRNIYRDFDAVYLTHLHRYSEAYYAGLNLLLGAFENFPGKWADKNDPVWDSSALRLRSMVCDLFQDTMRIGLRTDPNRECFIFVPTSDPTVVVRLMHLFRGAKFVHPDKKSRVRARAAATVSDPLFGDMFGTPDRPAGSKAASSEKMQQDLADELEWGSDKNKGAAPEAQVVSATKPAHLGSREVSNVDSADPIFGEVQYEDEDSDSTR